MKEISYSKLFFTNCKPIMIPPHTKYINMFSPYLFLYDFPICPYTLFYSLYIYIRPQFNSLCKIPPQRGCTQAKPKGVSTYLLCALRARQGNAHSKGLRSPAQKGCWTTTLSPIFSRVPTPTQHGLWVSIVSSLLTSRKFKMIKLNQSLISDAIWS